MTLSDFEMMWIDNMKQQNKLINGFHSYLVFLMFFCVIVIIVVGIFTGNSSLMKYVFIPLGFEVWFAIMKKEEW